METIIESENYNQNKIRLVNNKQKCDTECYLELRVELSNFCIWNILLRYFVIVFGGVLILYFIFAVSLTKIF